MLGRVSEFTPLSHAEETSFEALMLSPITVGRRRTIRAEGAQVEHLYLLMEGWVSSSMSLRNGGRQLLKIHLPGDVLGAPSIASATAIDSLVALNSCVIRPLPIARLGQIFSQHPRIGATLFLSANKERIALNDTLASVARFSASERLGRLLIDLYERLEAIGQAKHGTLQLVITQEEVADSLGLTTVHVNRMFRELNKNGLVHRAGREITLNLPGLRALSQLPPRAFAYEPTWLPSASS